MDRRVPIEKEISQDHPMKLALERYRKLKQQGSEQVLTWDEAVANEKKKLSGAARIMLRGIMHRSKIESLKFREFWNRIEGLPVSHHKPALEEEKYSRHVKGDDRYIACIKASEFPFTTDILELRLTQRSAEKSPLLEHEKNPWGGVCIFTVASDVMYREGDVPLFQPKNIDKNDPNLKDKLAQHLMSRYGSKKAKPGDVHLVASETTAVQELAGIGAYWQREISFSVEEFPDSFIYALVYGSDDGRVDSETREYFEAIYRDYPDPEDRKNILGGWSKETGVDAARQIQVNDGLKIDNPFMWAFIRDLDGIKNGDPGFVAKRDKLIRLVLADPEHLHELLRTVMQIEINPKKYAAWVEKMRNDPLTRDSQRVNASFPDVAGGLMGTMWLDVKSSGAISEDIESEGL